MDEPDQDGPPEAAGAAVDEQPSVEGAGPADVPEADAFRFDQVDQVGEPDQVDQVGEPDEAGGRAHGAGIRPELTLDFDAGGIEVTGPEAGHRQSMRWSEVGRVSLGRPTVDPDGRTETPIDLESTAGAVRYLVRSDGSLAVPMAALEVQVARWTAPGRPDPPPGDPTDVGGAVPPLPTPPMTDPPAPVAYPPPAVPPGYAPPAPYAFDTSGPIGPYSPYGVTAPAGGRKRTRRTVTLVVGVILLLSGVGLAIGLSVSTTTPPAPRVATAPASSPDQRLAQQLLLTKGDLPVGWRASTNPGTAANSPALQRGEARITSSLAQCMGITDAEGAVVLGGQSSDQTAQTSSPIFVAPTAATAQTAVELQTAATVVRSHRDEQQDFALFTNPRYPQCAATASAEELQLGVNQTSGGGDQAGPATVTPVDLPGASGVQLSGLLMAFSVEDGTATVPVQVESITLGAHRVEAGLEVFAIGGQIPSQALSASISTFERRVASGGASSVV
jgi:hypothetical protein